MRDKVIAVSLALALVATASWLAYRRFHDPYAGRAYDVTAQVQSGCRFLQIDTHGLRLVAYDPPFAWRGRSIKGRLDLHGSSGREITGTFTSDAGHRRIEVAGGRTESLFLNTCIGWQAE